MWLEETKLKKCNNLQQLKNVNHPDWLNYFENYKKTVGCPQLSTRTEEVEWLLGSVIQQEYSEKSKPLMLLHNFEKLSFSDFREYLQSACS